jgi:late competence protein required for DNA uptake (superfamily II DNA/RNA helicase)
MMKKTERRTVDDRLPKWLHSKILSAVDFIWQGKQESMEESLKRVAAVDASLTDEEMNWVMMLLILPKIKDMIKTSDDYKDFSQMKKATRH